MEEKKKRGRPKKYRPARRTSDPKPYRPGIDPLYTDPQVMLDKINEYFENGSETKQITIGREPNLKILEKKVYTIIGLALYLGFPSRGRMYDYQRKNDEFHDVIMYGRSMVAKHYEGLMQAGGVSPAGLMFLLSNIDGMTPLSDPNGGEHNDDAIQRITFTKTINNHLPPKTEKVIDITENFDKQEKEVAKSLKKKRVSKKDIDDLLDMY